MDSNNYKWLIYDIYESMLLSLYRLDNGKLVLYENYEILKVTDCVSDEVDVKFANIDDLTKLLTTGIFRFSNVMDQEDFIDVPIRKLLELYNKGVDFSKEFDKDNVMPLLQLDCFAIRDGVSVQDNYVLGITKIGPISIFLYEFLEIANGFERMDMQEKFDALGKINIINYNRMKEEKIKTK